MRTPGPVFISHAIKDEAIAQTICLALEKESSLKCWIAPRNIPVGMEWATAIVGAIRECSLAVLIFSKHANASNNVSREMQLAAQSGKSIISFKIDNTQPADTLAYFISMTQSLDASRGCQQKEIDRLVESVKAQLGITLINDEYSDTVAPICTRLKEEREVEALLEESHEETNHGASTVISLTLQKEVVRRRFREQSTICIEGDKFNPVAFGRDEASVDIVVASRSASRQHARIEFLGTRPVPVIFDENSMNGTFVNQRRITRRRFHINDALQIADTKFILKKINYRSVTLHSLILAEETA